MLSLLSFLDILVFFSVSYSILFSFFVHFICKFPMKSIFDIQNYEYNNSNSEKVFQFLWQHFQFLTILVTLFVGQHNLFMFFFSFVVLNTLMISKKWKKKMFEFFFFEKINFIQKLLDSSTSKIIWSSLHKIMILFSFWMENEKINDHVFRGPKRKWEWDFFFWKKNNSKMNLTFLKTGTNVR